jgi:hypothetical protein
MIDIVPRFGDLAASDMGDDDGAELDLAARRSDAKSVWPEVYSARSGRSIFPLLQLPMKSDPSSRAISSLRMSC